MSATVLILSVVLVSGQEVTSPGYTFSSPEACNARLEKIKADWTPNKAITELKVRCLPITPEVPQPDCAE